MILDQMHPEDVKAAIRKRFGTVAQFVRSKDLPATGVADLLRGRTSGRVREAVEDVLRAAEREESMSLDDSRETKGAHSLNEGGR